MAANDHPENRAPRLRGEGATLEEIAEAAESCVSCHLYENATQTMFGMGPNGPRSC